MLGMRLAVLHNLYFYNELMERIRKAIERTDLKNSDVKMLKSLHKDFNSAKTIIK